MKRTRIALVAFFLLTAITAAHSSSAAPATHTIEVRLQWDLDVPVQFTMLGSAVGQQAILTATGSSSTIPGTTMGLSGQTAWFKISPIESGVTYALSVATLGNTCSPKARVTTEWYYDGCLTQSRTYEFSSCYQPEIGRYTPGDTCAPRLLLDTDFQFDPSLHKDDLPQFVPGSGLDGTSIAPGSMPQAVRLVAVAPTGSGNVKFEFVPGSVSKFPGIAMNYPIDNADVSEDVYFLVPKDPKKPNGEKIKATSVSATLSSGVAMTLMYVNDYAAWASVTAIIPTGRRTPPAYVTIRVPQDTDGNQLPDSGWSAYPHSAVLGDSSLLQPASADLDSEPAGPLHEGDGLSAYEEYRGFVLAGNHVRLNPRIRDLFIDMDSGMNRSVVDLLPFSLLFVNPDEVKGEDVTRTTPFGSTTLQRIKPVINPNRAAAEGTTVPGSLPNGQRALRIINQIDRAPTKLMKADGLEHEVWKVGIAGVAFSDLFVDLNSTTGPGNPTVAPIDVKAVNKTQFVEYYPRYFSNYGVSTDFQHSYFDRFGNQVVNCTAAVLAANPNSNCDVFDTPQGVIRPYPKDGVEFFLNTVVDETNHPDDYYTVVPFFGHCDTRVKAKLSELEWDAMQAAFIGHEAAHGVDVPHQGTCGEMMYTVAFYNPDGTLKEVHSVGDHTPVPTDYSITEMELMRLWEP